MTPDQAAGHVESWLARRVVRILNPGPRHAELLFRLLRDHGAGGNLTTESHLAALAIVAGRKTASRALSHVNANMIVLVEPVNPSLRVAQLIAQAKNQ